MSARPGRPAGRRLIPWAPVVLLLAFEFWSSSRPPVLGHGEGQLPLPDKLAHLAFFGLVGFLAARAGRVAEGWSARRTLATVAVGALLWGISDEWHQSFTPGRDSEAADVVADVAGTLLGVAAFELLARSAARGGSRPA
ncbi:MAG: VanZ family protein [Thermoanaerobaculia bacterium]